MAARNLGYVGSRRKALLHDPGFLKALVQQGILATVEVRNPVNRYPMNVIPLATLQNFEEQYVSLFELADRFHVHHAPIAKLLKAKEISSAFDSKQIYASFFKRKEIPDGLLDGLTQLSRPSKRLKKAQS
ncbi:MAG: hypothetical protein ACYC5H_06445 [Methylovirgula sp.]